MKKIYLAWFVLTLLSTVILASDEFYPQSFADFQQKFGGTIPFPPEKLTDSLLSLDEDSTINAAIFPHGRSLERSATDFSLPRTVLSWKSSKSSTPYYLFIGYTPSRTQLEIISWNWNTRQFDFGIVTDYAAGKKPRFISANKLGCIACHQSRVPIFPVLPWSETTFNSKITNRIKLETKDPFALSLFKNIDRQKISSPVFDFNNAGARSLAQIQGFCQNACGGNLWCRRQVLETALVETKLASSAFEHFSEQEFTKRLLIMKQHWPLDFFSFMSEKIPDRILGTDEREITIDQDPLRIRKNSNSISPDFVNDVDFLPRYRDCWNFNQAQISQIAQLNKNEIKSVMQTEQLNKLVQDWPPTEPNIILAIKSALSEPHVITGPDELTWEAPIKIPRVVSDPSRPSKPTVELFQQYCMFCHRDGSIANAPPLPLGDLEILKAYIGTAKRTVKEIIDPTNPLMPPLFAPQPSKEEFEQMSAEMTK